MGALVKTLKRTVSKVDRDLMWLEEMKVRISATAALSRLEG